jgi:polynucleotide 5'-hydroxyl-kinase GRC3/NOL9
VERPSITLSSVKPSKDTIRELEDGTLCIRVAPGEVSAVVFKQCFSVDRTSV